MSYIAIRDNIIGNWFDRKNKIAIAFNQDKSCSITTMIKIKNNYSRLVIVHGYYEITIKSEVIITYKNQDFLQKFFNDNEKITLKINDISNGKIDLNISDKNYKNSNFVLRNTEAFYGEYCIYKWYDKYLTKDFSANLINTFNLYFYGLIILLMIVVPFFIIFALIVIIFK